MGATMGKFAKYHECQTSPEQDIGAQATIIDSGERCLFKLDKVLTDRHVRIRIIGQREPTFIALNTRRTFDQALTNAGVKVSVYIVVDL